VNINSYIYEYIYIYSELLGLLSQKGCPFVVHVHDAVPLVFLKCRPENIDIRL